MDRLPIDLLPKFVLSIELTHLIPFLLDVVAMVAG